MALNGSFFCGGFASGVLQVLMLVVACQVERITASQLFTTETGKGLLMVTQGKCALLSGYDSESMNDIRKKQSSLLEILPDENFDAMSRKCKTDNKIMFNNKWGFIPGSKWCGAGSSATNYWDVGIFKCADECCRDHDHCAKYLLSKECADNACNDSKYTKSHCDCDAKFYTCLQRCDSGAADTIGSMFFNILQLNCFEENKSRLVRKASEPSEMSYHSEIIFKENPEYKHLSIILPETKHTGWKWLLGLFGIS